MKIYTKTGDKGETSLLGGVRVKKNCLEIDAIGDVDELNAAIGMLLTACDSPGVRERLQMIQHCLFTVGSNVANVQMKLGQVPTLKESDVASLEAWIDEMEAALPALQQFILPGGHPAAAQAFFVRALCRRAERRVVELRERYPDLDPLIQTYLNRFSDALFVLGRWMNAANQVSDIPWKK